MIAKNELYQKCTYHRYLTLVERGIFSLRYARKVVVTPIPEHIMDIYRTKNSDDATLSSPVSNCRIL